MARHELLREHLAALELRRGTRRPEDEAATRAEEIDDAAIERQLRPDDREVDALALGEVEHRLRIAGDRQRPCVATAPCPALPGAQNNGATSGSAGELPGERVLAATAADDQNLMRRLGRNSSV